MREIGDIKILYSLQFLVRGGRFLFIQASQMLTHV